MKTIKTNKQFFLKLIPIFLFTILFIKADPFKPVYRGSQNMGLANNTSALIGSTFSLYGNPAGIGNWVQKYDVFGEGQIGDDKGFSTAIVDTYTSPLSAYVNYVFTYDTTNSHNIDVALAYRIGELTSFGFGMDVYIGPRYHSNYIKKAYVTFTPGLQVHLEKISLGIYSSDVFAAGFKNYTPTLTPGLSVNFKKAKLTTDHTIYFKKGDNNTRVYSPGLGLFIDISSIQVTTGYRLYFNRNSKQIKHHDIGLGLAFNTEKWALGTAVEYHPIRKSLIGSLYFRFTPLQK